MSCMILKPAEPVLPTFNGQTPVAFRARTHCYTSAYTFTNNRNTIRRRHIRPTTNGLEYNIEVMRYTQDGRLHLS
jgi:hypothetical protein